MRVRLFLFGTPRLEVDGKPVGLALRKLVALLAYVVLTHKLHSRDTLATLLWPEKDQQTARANLRRLLYEVGQLLGEQILEVGPENVGLLPDAPLWLDIDEFRRSLAGLSSTVSPTHASGKEKLDPTQLARLEQAAALYTADFMAGFTLPDCPEFDEWQFFQREELRSAYAGLLRVLVSGYEVEESWEDALRWVRRWLSLDSLDETVHRRTMQLYAQAGQAGAALRQYDECVRLLAEELDVSPEPETTTLYEAIRARRFPIKPVSPAAPPSIPAPSPTPLPAAPSSPTPLPVSATPFVGRHQELAELLRHLNAPTCRLLTLVGPGGMGKTRLALEVMRTILEGSPRVVRSTTGNELPVFRDGCCFVPLQPVSTPGGMVSAVAAALGLQFYPGQLIEEQLMQYLREKELLLVLDSFEHLLGGSDLVVGILAAAPKVKILITSREALKLQEEWFHPLAGMRLPPLGPQSGGALSKAKVDEITDTSDAVRLFIQTAQRAVVTFDPVAEFVHVVRICRLVDGMPLAIELAASWLRVLSCVEIAAEIARGVDILVARHHNVPARHRSMRAVLEQSWALLNEQEQIVFRRLSVFQGSFRMEAAMRVAGASLPVFGQLVEKALIRASANGFYQVHELLRQFGAEQLQTLPDEQELTRKRHCDYFLSLVQQQLVHLKGKQYPAAFAEITINFDNILAAWDYAVQQNDLQALDVAAEGLWIYADSRGTFQEIEAVLAAAVRALGEPADICAREHHALLAFMQGGAGYLCNRRGDTEQGRALMDEALDRLRPLQTYVPRKLAIVLLYRGWLSASSQRYELGMQLGHESLALFTQLQDDWGRTASTELLSAVARDFGLLHEARRISEEGLALSLAAEAYKLRGGFLQKLGVISMLMGDYDRARRYLDEALTIAIPIGSLPSMTQIRCDQARLLICQGSYAPAARLMEETLEAVQHTGYRWQVRVLPVLGMAYRLLGNTASAQDHYETCLQIAQAAGDRVATAICRAGLGLLALGPGDYHHAELLLRKALAELTQLERQIEVAAVCADLGHVLAMAGDAREPDARQHYRRALSIALRHGLVPLALDVMVGVAQLLAAKGDFARAGELSGLAIAHPAAMAETKQNARMFWHAPRSASTSSSPAQAGSHLPDWRLAAEQLLEELTDTTPQGLGAFG